MVASRRIEGGLRAILLRECAVAVGVDGGLDRDQVAECRHLVVDQRIGGRDPGRRGEDRDGRAVIRFGRGCGACLLERGVEPRGGRDRILDRGEGHHPERAHRGDVAVGHRLGRWQRADRERELAVEPRLDVAGVRLLAVRRVADQVVEDLIELAVERCLVGEARELREERPDGLLLIAGEVETDLAIDDGVLGDIAEDGRGRRAAGEQRRGGRGGTDDERDDRDGGRPAETAPAALRRVGACDLDRGGDRPGHVVLVDRRPAAAVGATGGGQRCRRRDGRRLRHGCGGCRGDGRRERRPGRLVIGRARVPPRVEIVGHRCPLCRVIAGQSTHRGPHVCRRRRAASSVSASRGIASPAG